MTNAIVKITNHFIAHTHTHTHTYTHTHTHTNTHTHTHNFSIARDPVHTQIQILAHRSIMDPIQIYPTEMASKICLKTAGHNNKETASVQCTYSGLLYVTKFSI